MFWASLSSPLLLQVGGHLTKLRRTIWGLGPTGGVGSKWNAGAASRTFAQLVPGVGVRDDVLDEAFCDPQLTSTVFTSSLT
jgi:hypothetical protein